MLDVLTVTFPFFALVLAGYVAARRRLLALEAVAESLLSVAGLTGAPLPPRGPPSLN